jgi:short-subunit dehydrogenase
MNRPPSVVVLGASSGLGAALALIHARRGDQVTVIARRADRLLQLRRELLPVAPADCWESVRSDLTDPSDIELLANHLSKRPVDRIYLAAGADQPDLAGDVTSRLGTIEPYFRLLFCTYIALTEHMIEQSALTRRSEIVAISSLAAVIPFPGLELYSAGKAALEAWCRQAARRGGPRFIIVRPGLFKSEFFTPSDILQMADIPMDRAAKIVRLIDSGHDFIDVGGWRDVTASRLSSLIGRQARRVIHRGDFDGSSVLG